MTKAWLTLPAPDPVAGKPVEAWAEPGWHLPAGILANPVG